MELINKQRTPKVIECKPQGALTFQDLPVNIFKRTNFISFSFCYPKIQSKVIKKELHADLIEKVKLEKDKSISLSKRKEGEDE